MSRACLAVGVHLGVKKVYAEVAVKAVALGRIRHMRHGMHACSHSLAVVCNPYGAPVPRKALQALHYGGVFFCYRLAVRMIPAAEAPCTEAFAGTHISHRKLGALVQPIAAALEPVQQHYAALEDERRRSARNAGKLREKMEND